MNKAAGKTRLAILASGAGSNADRIISYFHNNVEIEVVLVITNKPEAGVIQVAAKHGVDCRVFPKRADYESDTIFDLLWEQDIHYLVLAGFLLHLPERLIQAFPGKILNIHPALLPKYGGKGMYGSHVHRAVKESGDLVTGITIHEVNEHYDEGNILFSAECVLLPEDDADEIQKKVHQLEHQHYPVIIEKFVKGEL